MVSPCCVMGVSPEFTSAITGCVVEASDDWRLRFLTKRMVNQTREPIIKRPTTPPTVTPMIRPVSAGLLDGVEVLERVEGVVVGMFPTVDSRRFEDSDAFSISNVSFVTTSKYAHPGTAVTGLITCGYLSSDVNSCLKINELSNGGHT